MMHLSLIGSGTLGILTLRGNLIEHPAEELQGILSQSLDQVNRLIVNCEQVTAVDSLRLRLLCVAYRVSGVFHKEFFLAGASSMAFVNAVKNAGYEWCPGERVACEAGCLWAKSWDRNDVSAPALDTADAQALKP